MGSTIVFSPFSAHFAAPGRYGYQDKEHGHGPNVWSINKLVGRVSRITVNPCFDNISLAFSYD